MKSLDSVVMSSLWCRCFIRGQEYLLDLLSSLNCDWQISPGALANIDVALDWLSSKLSNSGLHRRTKGVAVSARVNHCEAC